MGCASSTEVTTDPHTGQEVKKHKMGGAYPGNRTKPMQQYTPAASDFNAQGQATAHFVSYGGGNALVLQQNGVAQPQVGQKQPQYIQVTLPEGVHAGQTIHVQAPDGKINEIVVPQGFGPGSTFTVEFAEEDQKPPEMPYKPAPQQSSYPTAPVAPSPAANPNHDDGFASGFNNPNFVPSPAPAAVQASYAGGEEEIDLSSYPAASDAKPVYSSTPKY